MQKLDIEFVKRKGKEVRLFLKDKEYPGGKQLLNWKCKEHGIVQKRAGDVIYKKQGCPRCSKRPPITIETVRKLVEIKKKGKLFSPIYENNRQKLKIECQDGHQFLMSWTCLQRGQWCPTCGKYGRREWLCKAILESIFKNHRFKKVHPRWLRERSNKRVNEIDGYNEKLKLAFEYHGEQHYDYVYAKRRYGISYEEFKYRKENDKLKEEIIKSKGIKLLVIPYYLKTGQDIVDFIRKEIGISKRYDFEDLIKSNSFKEASIPHFVEEMKILASKIDAIFPDQPYLGSQEYHLWICKKCHQKWRAVPSAIKHGGTRCPKCYGNPEYSTKDYAKWCSVVNLKNLSDFFGMNKKHPVECLKCSRKFEARPATIKKGHSCAECAGNAPKIIEDLRKKLVGRHICIVSETRKMNRRMFVCRCQICNHVWSTTYYVLYIKEHGCRKCADKELSRIKISSMKDFQAALKKRNMKCLDQIFKGNQEYYRIKCFKCNNVWKAQARKVRYANGTNCPVCSRNEKRKYTIKDLYEIAKEKHGQCLSTEFSNIDTQYTWQCNKGHVFSKTLYWVLKTKNFCNECKRVVNAGR